MATAPAPGADAAAALLAVRELEETRPAVLPAHLLLPDWPERPWSWADVCMAQWWGAHEIRFWLPAINSMPDGIAATTVASALGRALYHIHGMIDERWHGLPRPRYLREWLRMTPQERHEQEPCGATVRRWLRRWGFDYDRGGFGASACH